MVQPERWHSWQQTLEEDHIVAHPTAMKWRPSVPGCPPKLRFNLFEGDLAVLLCVPLTFSQIDTARGNSNANSNERRLDDRCHVQKLTGPGFLHSRHLPTFQIPESDTAVDRARHGLFSRIQRSGENKKKSCISTNHCDTGDGSLMVEDDQP